MYTMDGLEYHIAYHHPLDEVLKQGGITEGVIDLGWKKDEDELYDIWKPTKKGQSVEGEVIEVDRPSKYNDLLILKQKNGEIAVPMRSALQGKNFEVGEIVKIEFAGKKRAEESGQTYMLFDVYRAE